MRACVRVCGLCVVVEVCVHSDLDLHVIFITLLSGFEECCIRCLLSIGILAMFLEIVLVTRNI